MDGQVAHHFKIYRNMNIFYTHQMSTFTSCDAIYIYFNLKKASKVKKFHWSKKMDNMNENI